MRAELVVPVADARETAAAVHAWRGVDIRVRRRGALAVVSWEPGSRDYAYAQEIPREKLTIRFVSKRRKHARPTKCRQCNGPMPEALRADAFYCSPRCAYNAKKEKR